MPVGRALECADILTDLESWQARGLEEEYRTLKDEVDELKLFLGLPEKKQIDQMEESFNRCMRAGNYQEALEEATNALQQFRRYNWSIDTVRVLLKTAQAYRKVTQFTSARRYCKQALLVIDNLSKQAGGGVQSIELIKQKAHTDFTMGRILWEIGNTAEAATHFRHARESYLEHRDHKDLTVASEMREGLARSVQYEGFMRFRIGEFDQALEFLEWAEEEYRAMGNDRRVSKALNLKARIYRDRNDEGDIDRARKALDEALELVLAVGDNYTIAECYLTYMILEYQESREPEGSNERIKYFDKAEEWYEAGAEYAHENGYALLQSVYEGIRGNILFDRVMIEASQGKEVDLRLAFDQFLEECRWDVHFEERRFFRSLDLLMQRLSGLTSDEIRHYNDYLLRDWKRRAQKGELPGEAQDGQYSDIAAEYVGHMERFCQLVEDFSEYIAKEQ
jgi:tetratricopeptide (TPR) repeat protein